MSKVVVMFDVDGVLAGFVEGFTAIRERLGGAPALTTMEQPEWDTLWEPKEAWDEINQDPCFWSRLPALPGFDEQAVERINNLTWRAGPVYFVTTRPGVRPKQQTEDWLLKKGVWRPTVLLTKWKGEAAKVLGATYSIEDKAENASAVAWMSPRTRSYLLHRLYNEYDPKVGSSKVVRIHSLGEFLDAVEADACGGN